MPLQLNIPNFLGQGEKAPDYSGISNMFENALKGYKMAKEPAAMERTAEKENLANALQQLALEHKPREMELSDALKQAQAKYYGERAEGRGVGGQKFTGEMKNWMAAHPNATQEEIQQKQEELSRIQEDKTRAYSERQSVLNKTQAQRNRTAIGKTMNELEEVKKGYMPGTNQKLTPEQQETMKNQYELDLIKKTSDPLTRAKIGYATNIDKTLDAIDVPSLTQYAGLEGEISKKLDQGEALTGEENKAYEAYQKALVGAEMLTSQVRQFYGDSIQPKMMERLERLANPSFWNNNPQIAAQMFKQFETILRSETNTYRDLVKKSSTFLGKAKNEINDGLQQTNDKKNQLTGGTFNLATGEWK